MRKFLFIALCLLSVGVSAGTLECTQTGYTDLSVESGDVKLSPQFNSFVITNTTVVTGEDTYEWVDPETVWLEGQAKTYLQKESAKLLYIYTNPKGEKEVGISHLKEDSDDMFRDKSVFTGCTFRG